LRSGVAGTAAEPAVIEISNKADRFEIDEALIRITALRGNLSTAE
jgi:hypothetical protein